MSSVDAGPIWIELTRDGDLSPRKMSFAVRTKSGILLPIARSYVEQLVKLGWKGTEQIPEECLV